VLSDLPAHRETLGNAALFFAPLDAEALVAQLELVLADGELRRSLSARGRAAVAGFSWDTSAERLQALVDRVAGPAPGTRRG
jgi:glycosyltransferase involved in cell wall biosynthesis